MRGSPPSPAVAFGQFLACQLFLEASFYWSHRLLHVPALYKRFHKQVTHAQLFARWNHNSLTMRTRMVAPLSLAEAPPSCTCLPLVWVWRYPSIH